VHCGEDVKQLRHLGELDAALPLDAGDAHANVLVFSTDDGSDEGDTDDEEEGDGEDDESDEAMSQDSNGQDDDNEEVDGAGGSEDDEMEDSSDDSDDVSGKVLQEVMCCKPTLADAGTAVAAAAQLRSNTWSPKFCSGAGHVMVQGVLSGCLLGWLLKLPAVRVCLSSVWAA
jgi:hypothetical protein